MPEPMPDSTRRTPPTETAAKAVGLWRGEADSLRHVADSANRVYGFRESGRTRYLRLVSSLDRTREQVEAELDFVRHLARGGASVALPLASANGRFVEELRADNHLLFASVFEEAAGEPFSYEAGPSALEHFRLRGRTLGQIHALSQAYVPAVNSRRFAWDEDGLLLEADSLLPDSERVVRRAYHALRERLRGLPKSPSTFGLIHGDFGETNYRQQGGRLNVFDFDDSCYHWFAYDLAVTIYPHGRRPEALRLLDSLLEGYAEHIPTRVTPGELTMFCQWRLIYMFLVYARRWGFERLTGQQAQWFARRRENIARGYTWGA